jgi:uncharacterized membrane protein
LSDDRDDGPPKEPPQDPPVVFPEKRIADKPFAGQPILTQITAQAFSGPLPPPEILALYNNAFPGCAQRIVAMAEDQASHRQYLEKRVVDSNCQNERLGQIFGFFLGMTGLVCGTILIACDKDVSGFTVLIGSIGSLIGAFVYARRQQAKEREEKAKILPPSASPPRSRPPARSGS